MPEYDEQFEWVIPLAELHSRQIEVTVATHKGFLGGSPVIGQVIITFFFIQMNKTGLLINIVFSFIAGCSSSQPIRDT